MNQEPIDSENEEPSLLPQAGRSLGRVLKFPSELATAASIDWSLGWVASPKLDGNRCLVLGGVPYTSSMRRFRNERLMSFLAPVLERSAALDCAIDLELYDPSGDHHAALSGALNSYSDPLPASTIAYAFDACSMSHYRDQCSGFAFERRIEFLHSRIAGCGVSVADYQEVEAWSQAEALFEKNIQAGTEGLILRSKSIRIDGSKFVGGWLKHGRSTINQQIGFKMKLYNTCDGVIVDVVQRRKMKDDGSVERKLNPDGTLAKVNNKDAYELDDCVGAFIVQYQNEEGDLVQSEVGFGVGYDMAERRRLWEARGTLFGKWIEFTHMPHGAKDKARHGRLKRFRPDLDGVSEDDKHG